MLKKNLNYFECIDTQEKAYWLGFIYTDGYINPSHTCLRVEVKSTDDILIRKFGDLFDKSVKYATRNQNNKTYTSAYVSIYSKKLVGDLKKLGIVNRKSTKDIYTFFEHIPSNLMSHFIRGVFDGDGTIKKSGQFCIYGRLEFLTIIKKHLLNSVSLSNLGVKKHGSIYKITYSGNFNLLKIYNYIYKNSTIQLDRKKTLMSTFKPKKKYRGVFKKHKKYEVYLSYNNVRLYLGCYKSIKLGALVYDYFVRRLDLKVPCNFIKTKKSIEFNRMMESLYLGISLEYRLK